MSTLILSDLHLDPGSPQRTRLFETVCATAACRAHRLLILGDLFEAWIGDDDGDPLAERVAAALRGLARRGVSVAFQHGNRDFLLGPGYAARCAMTLLGEEAVIEVGGARIVLMHGDSLCSDDTAYQAVRTQLRDRAWQQRFLAAPIEARRAFAAEARQRSRMHGATLGEVLGDVTPSAVADALRRHGASCLIHGHTHRPATHHGVLDDRPVARHVTADWGDDEAPLLWLHPDADGGLRVQRETLRADAAALA